jgi:hypothetical protein
MPRPPKSTNVSARCPFGENHLMMIEFEMEVFEAVDCLDLPDRRAVDEKASGKEHAIDDQRMLGRHEQVARRHAVGQRAGFDADRQHVAIAGNEPTVIGASANPLDRLGLTRQCDDPVADREVLDRQLAPFGADQRAAAEAGRLLADQSLAGAVIRELKGVTGEILARVEIDDEGS